MTELERAKAKDQDVREYELPAGNADPVQVLGAFGNGFDRGWAAAINLTLAPENGTQNHKSDLYQEEL